MSMITAINHQAWTTSLLIAEKFKKRHDLVLRAIRNLECSTAFMRRNFEEHSYVDGRGNLQPMYRISRDGFSMLAMGFTGKEATAWKEKLIKAFNAMETQLLKDSEERKLIRSETKISIRQISFALTETRTEAGKDTPAYIHSNEARMLKTIMHEMFGVTDRGAMNKVQLKALDSLQRMDSHLISKGIPYSDRKNQLWAYAARLSPNNRRLQASLNH